MLVLAVLVDNIVMVTIVLAEMKVVKAGREDEGSVDKLGGNVVVPNEMSGAHDSVGWSSGDDCSEGSVKP